MEQLKWLTLGEKLVEQLLEAHGDFPYNFRFVELSIPYFPEKKQADIAQKVVVNESDFLRAVSSVEIADALSVLDELMSALYVANPKVYNGVMRKLERLKNE